MNSDKQCIQCHYVFHISLCEISESSHVWGEVNMIRTSVCVSETSTHVLGHYDKHGSLCTYFCPVSRGGQSDNRIIIQTG